jgi:chemotaxis protein methyltransferase CheR
MDDYDEFREYLERACGISLGENKRYLVNSRLSGLLREHGMASLAELVARLRRSGEEGLRQRAVDAMTTNETQWFRDGYPFLVLKDVVLPALGRQGSAPLRIWSAGCSSGQEAYSISMAVEEFRFGQPGRLVREVEVLGTDLSSRMLAVARAGVFDQMAVSRGLSPERQSRFFVTSGGQWRVRDEVRRRVSLRELNLLSGFGALGRFDAIFCRNVLIYFAPERKLDILVRMARALNPGGFLILGASEALPAQVSGFEMIQHGGGVFYRLKDRAGTQPADAYGSALAGT